MHRDYQIWHDREHLLRLDNPDREQIMPKTPVLEAVNASLDMRVADIGAGLGYFALPLAVAVGVYQTRNASSGGKRHPSWRPHRDPIASEHPLETSTPH